MLCVYLWNRNNIRLTLLNYPFWIQKERKNILLQKILINFTKHNLYLLKHLTNFSLRVITDNSISHLLINGIKSFYKVCFKLKKLMIFIKWIFFFIRDCFRTDIFFYFLSSSCLVLWLIKMKKYLFR